jgi:integrase
VPRKELVIEIRNQRLRGGLLKVSARTTSKVEFRAREAAVRALLAGGHLDLIERLRRRSDPLHIADVARAHKEHDFDRLRMIGQDNAPLTLQANIDRLLESVLASRSAGTWKQYDVVCRQLLARFHSDTLITEITSDQLREFLHEPKETTGNKPWAPARQQLAAALIGRLFNVAIAVEAEVADRANATPRIRRNPVRNVDLAEAAHRVEFLRPVEWRKLSEKSAGRAVHALVALGVLAGLRMGEAVHLRLGIDIEELDGAKPRLRIQPRGGKYPWVPKGWPRSKRSARVVPIGGELQGILNAHIATGFCGEVYLLKTPTGADRPLFEPIGRNWTSDAFTAAGIRYGRSADALTHHSLRHTFISWLVQRDVSLKKIETLAGTSVKMILTTYGHLIDDNLEQAVALVDEVGRNG